MTNINPESTCRECPRLAAFLDEKRQELPDHFNAPVPNFYSPNPKLMIVGLAPGLHGANRTGRPFTGDWAGDLLFKTLDKYGFSEGVYDKRIEDGLTLQETLITNAVRCVPPKNRPVGLEIRTCRKYLKAQIKALPKLKVILCLGKISHDSTVRALGLKLADHKFGHRAQYDIGGGRILLSSYHCSRYNTNTRRLTEAMFFDVFAQARALIEQTDPI